MSDPDVENINKMIEMAKNGIITVEELETSINKTFMQMAAESASILNMPIDAIISTNGKTPPSWLWEEIDAKKR
jgi:hypothetical protein